MGIAQCIDSALGSKACMECGRVVSFGDQTFRQLCAGCGMRCCSTSSSTGPPQHWCAHAPGDRGGGAVGAAAPHHACMRNIHAPAQVAHPLPRLLPWRRAPACMRSPMHGDACMHARARTHGSTAGGQTRGSGSKCGSTPTHPHLTSLSVDVGRLHCSVSVLLLTYTYSLINKYRPIGVGFRSFKPAHEARRRTPHRHATRHVLK